MVPYWKLPILCRSNIHHHRYIATHLSPPPLVRARVCVSCAWSQSLSRIFAAQSEGASCARVSHYKGQRAYSQNSDAEAARAASAPAVLGLA